MKISSVSFHILLAHILYKYVHDETNKRKKLKKLLERHKSNHLYKNCQIRNHIVMSKRADHQKCFLLTSN